MLRTLFVVGAVGMVAGSAAYNADPASFFAGALTSIMVGWFFIGPID